MRLLSFVTADGTVDADDVTMQLFPLSDSAARHMLSRLGRRVLAKRVYPHLLRHSSATYWCNKLSYFQICKRFGWTMTSDMPQRYIDREGVEELAVARKYHEGDQCISAANSGDAHAGNHEVVDDLA